MEGRSVADPGPSRRRLRGRRQERALARSRSRSAGALRRRHEPERCSPRLSAGAARRVTGFPTQALRLHAGGHWLEAAWHGPPPDEAATLVLLHEGLGCVAGWRDFPARLAAATGLGVLVYSRAGYGGSDPARLPR